MTLYSEVPESLTVSHAAICPLNASTFTVEANEGAVIALTVNGEIIGVADATGTPQPIPITPQTVPGTLRITVTKANHFRYDESIPLEPDQAVWNGGPGADRARLAPSSPSPFSGVTRIDYTVPGSGKSLVRLDVHDATGRLVRTLRTLINEVRPAGNGSVTWDGNDGDGNPTKGGVYFCRLSVGGQQLTERLLHIK
jgi:hypothetical protein